MESHEFRVLDILTAQRYLHRAAAIPGDVRNVRRQESNARRGARRAFRIRTTSGHYDPRLKSRGKSGLNNGTTTQLRE